MAWAADARGDPPTYDARVIDLVRALRGETHRPLSAAPNDWLSHYLSGGHQ